MHLPAMHLLFVPHDWFSLTFWHTGGLAFVLQDWQVGVQAGLQATRTTRQAKGQAVYLALKGTIIGVVSRLAIVHNSSLCLADFPSQAPRMQRNQGARNSHAGGM